MIGLKEIVHASMAKFRVVAAPLPAAESLGAGLPLPERMEALLPHISYRLASSRKDLLAVERLRSDSYRCAGVVGASNGGGLIDDWDFSDNGAVFTIVCSGRLCASVRIHVSTDEAFQNPATAAYPAELLPLLRNGDRLVALSCLCIDPAKLEMKTLFTLCALRLGFMVAQLRSRTTMTLWSQPEHADFYRRILGFRPLGAARLEPGRTAPLVLLFSDVDRTYRTSLRWAPFLAAAPGEPSTVLAGSFL